MFRIIMYSISLLITGGLNLFSLTWHSDVEFENYSCILYVDMWILVSPMSEDAVYIVVKLCDARDPLIWSILSGWYKCFPHFLGLLGVEWWTLKNVHVMEFFLTCIFFPWRSRFFDLLVLGGLLIFFQFFFLFLLPRCKIIRPLLYIGRLILAEEFNCVYRPQTYIHDCILVTLSVGICSSFSHCKLKIFYIFEYLKPFCTAV